MKRPSGLHRSYFWVKLVVAMVTLFFASKTLQRDSATPSEHIVQRPVRRRSTQDLPTSSVECTDAEWKHRVCWVRNLLLFGKSAVFVSADLEVSLPHLRLFEHSSRNGTSLSQLVRVMSHKDVESLLRPMPGRVTGEADLEQGQLVAPQRRPGHSLAAFQILDAAVALQPFLLNNWWHAHDDTSQATFRFCKYLGKCHHADFQPGSTSVLIFNSSPLDEAPAAVQEMFSCLGISHRMEKHGGSLPTAGSGPPILIKTAVFGSGDEIVHPYLAETLGVRRANGTMRMLQLQVMRRCAGLPDDSPRRQVPVLRVVNREHHAGRSIEGIDEVLHLFQQAKPPELAVDVQGVTFVSRMSYSEQARLFDATDIIVQPHGAATANFAFLPRHAVVIQVANQLAHRIHDQGIVEGLPKPGYNVTFLPFECDGNTVPVLDKLLKDPQFLALNETDQLYFLKNSNRLDARSYDILQRLKGWHVGMYFLNYRPKVKLLAEAMVNATQLWHAKHALLPGGAVE